VSLGKQEKIMYNGVKIRFIVMVFWGGFQAGHRVLIIDITNSIGAIRAKKGTVGDTIIL